MRRLLLTVAFALVFSIPARSDDVGDFRDRVLKAAAKDPAEIQKFKMYTLKAKGTSRVSGESQAATFDLTAVYPGKLKATWEFGGDGKQFVTSCASDDRGWRRGSNFPVVDLAVEELNDFRTDTYGVFSSTLLTLTEKDTKVSMGDRSKVGPDSVTGLKLSRRPFPEITLYFDDKTSLLRKMVYRSRENGVIFLKETVYGGHKAIGALTLPTTQTTFYNNKEVYTWTEMTFDFPDKLDGKTFDRP